MKIRIDFGEHNIMDIYAKLPCIPKKGDSLVIPYEMIKLREGRITNFDDICKVKLVIWDMKYKIVSILVDHNISYVT